MAPASKRDSMDIRLPYNLNGSNWQPFSLTINSYGKVFSRMPIHLQNSISFVFPMRFVHKCSATHSIRYDTKEKNVDRLTRQLFCWAFGQKEIIIRYWFERLIFHSPSHTCSLTIDGHIRTINCNNNRRERIIWTIVRCVLLSLRSMLHALIFRVLNQRRKWKRYNKSQCDFVRKMCSRKQRLRLWMYVPSFRYIVNDCCRWIGFEKPITSRAQ